MNTYHKINTVYKRDMDSPRHPLIVGDWARPEFELLQFIEWTYTEKVDGTNIRVMYNCVTNPLLDTIIVPLEFRGKTDKAEIQKNLMLRLPEILTVDKLRSVFDEATNVCLYGEGYGPKIQKGGGDYRKDAGFILFDIKIGRWWLQRSDVEKIGKTLEIPVVPIIGKGTLKKAIDLCIYGYTSRLRPTAPEGLVLKPAVELFNRKGERIITKLKLKDFAR